ncbi:Transcriptional regulator, contains XRE-family HTH domain [Limimonas halophila]|uniref:Transcriptional regulator, contains XRE-family HTH domain n=1 Tax=Limimonas halophila TaxID=1082479 RepID=A0A1G7SL57_9PROT|nr:helix-turn-helix domain-containing protein [Limimonas halophila]SDG23795.1 Transcriptional regulator, contains XRE-family HTH domain [Limimonas halophila]
MTPFGRRLRALRAQHGLTLKAMATEIGVSPAYLSALEHGHRGRPNRRFVQQVCRVLGVQRDEADKLARLAALSHPRVTVDTAGLTPEATELANRLAEQIHTMSQDRIDRMLAELRREAPEDVTAGA